MSRLTLDGLTIWGTFPEPAGRGYGARPISRVEGGGISPALFQLREPRRSFVGPLLLVVLLHVGAVALANRARPPERAPAEEPVKVVLKLPVRKVAVNEPPGGGPARPAPTRRQRVRHPLRPPKVIPPPIVETPPPPLPLPDPPQMAEAEEAGDDDGDALEGPPGAGGGGSGTGSGPGTGPGLGSVASKARKAWLARTDWNCRRPGYDEVGRVVVRLRVYVQPDGKPGQVVVTKPGPEDFNRRAVDCARDETYLPALDPEGRPIPGDCEFGIEFLN